MDRKSREYEPVMHEDYPNESQPLTKRRYSNCSEADVDDFVPPKDHSRSHAASWKCTVVAVLLALACNIASGCFGFYYGKRNLDTVCSTYTTQYCESSLRRTTCLSDR